MGCQNLKTKHVIQQTKNVDDIKHQHFSPNYVLI